MPGKNGASSRVGLGTAALDKAEPSWAARLEMATFDLNRPGRSLLVQLFGSMDAGLATLGIPPDRAAAYAFLDIDPAEISAWRVLISSRLAKGGHSGKPPTPR